MNLSPRPTPHSTSLATAPQRCASWRSFSSSEKNSPDRARVHHPALKERLFSRAKAAPSCFDLSSQASEESRGIWDLLFFGRAENRSREAAASGNYHHPLFPSGSLESWCYQESAGIFLSPK